MNKWNIWLSMLILVSNLIISYTHSVELFRLGGFHGIYAHLGVISIELMFLQGAINIIVSRYKGNQIGAPAIVSGVIGLLLVGLSNVSAGWSYGWIGVVLGVAIPVGLVVSESLLARTYLTRFVDGRLDQPEEQNTQPPILERSSEQANGVEVVSPSMSDVSPTEWDGSPTGWDETPNILGGAPTGTPDLLNWIEQYRNETGEIPSRYKMKNELGVSEYKARRSIEQFKNIAGVNI